MRRLSFILFSLFFSLTIQAQNQFVECDTELDQHDLNVIHIALSEYNAGNYKTTVDSNVPIKFHIIANTNGSGGIDSADVFDELTIVNQRYAGAGIRFIHCGNINYINNSSFYNFEKYIDETICDSNDVPNVLNVYFTSDIYRTSGTDTTYLCGYAYSSGVTMNRLIVDNGCAVNTSTLAHEIGHYFSLAHTHSTTAGSELVDGSNCATTGDELCDTPADPRLSTTNVSTSCIYTGTTTDANNQAYTPNARNILSYSRKTCRDYFSPMQLQRMNNYWLTYRNYLGCGSAPVGVNDIKTHVALNVYPNPVQDKICFTSNQTISSIEILSATGQQIINNISAANQVDVSSLSAGIYYYKATVSGKVHLGKFVKQ